MTTYISCQDAVEYTKKQMELMFDRVPFARKFHQGTDSDPEYYRRHIIETILRVRLNNKTDAYSLYKLDHTQNKLGLKLARYLAEEISHENFFVGDLKEMGITADELENIEPFLATDKLMAYLFFCANHRGPMATMVWGWFVEWYSDTYNRLITTKATEVVGKSGTRGFVRHIDFDDDHDHIGLMFETVMLTAKTPEDNKKIKQYISTYVDLIGEYFQELYDTTIGQRQAEAA